MRLFLFLFSSLLLVGCTEVQLVSHMVKGVSGGSKSQGDFKVGSPYKIDGKRYYPKETYNFTETGIASWYGRDFHGKQTANGEIYDMNELTAAHKTLQLPSLVRVTNLENGRSLIVRVNDRGPFKRGRVIDLSRRSAELLGFKNQGTAKVKLQVLGEESKAIAMAARRGEDTRGIEVAMNEGRRVPQLSKRPPPAVPEPVSSPSIQQASLQPVEQQPIGAPKIPGHMKDGVFLPDPVVQQMPVSPTSIFVQAGSFGSQDNAVRLAQRLSAFGSSQVYPAIVNGKQFYRVRLGPMPNVDNADTLLIRLANSGHDQAIIVVE